MNRLELFLLALLLGTILALAAANPPGVWDTLYPVEVTEPTIIERSQP